MNETGQVEVDACPFLCAFPLRPRQVDWDAPEAVDEDPGKWYGDVDSDYCIRRVAEGSGIEDSQEKQAHGDFCQGYLDFIEHHEGVEALKESFISMQGVMA